MLLKRLYFYPIEEKRDMLMVVVTSLIGFGRSRYQNNHTFERRVISSATIDHIWFGKLPILTPRWMKESLMVTGERGTRCLKIFFPGGGNELFIQNYHCWNYVDTLCWRQTLWGAVFFAVYFLTSYVCLILLATILHCVNFAALSYINIVESRFILVVMYYS